MQVERAVESCVVEGQLGVGLAHHPRAAPVARRQKQVGHTVTGPISMSRNSVVWALMMSLGERIRPTISRQWSNLSSDATSSLPEIIRSARPSGRG
ncbi:hypothetical protein ACFZC6_24235 [Streptomyces ossamyceticus]|uniref:hypothetical protein n=1 Tax=Streptomyces ossamyceticus TaxID=249581 RepID=UPI0036E7491E